MKTCGALWIFFCIAIRGWAYGSQKTDEAYVTLLYGDDFLLGVRVLGKSIRDTGSTKDMVALVSDGVSEYAEELLKADGWIVDHISLLANPNLVRPRRFWGVYTKLKIFNMTNYKKVVYLDADTIVVKKIDDLFKCGKFCANLKHSERLNSGVLVVQPSEAVFNDMMKKVKTLPSYTGGDQGFLNSYFRGFSSAHVFDPKVPLNVINSRTNPEVERLSTLYNADVGLYMLANKWMVDEREICVIHYTLGPLKPWDWWTAWLLKPVDVWQNVRSSLEETLPGTKGGRNPNDDLQVKLLFLLPLFSLLFWQYRLFLQARELFSSPCRSSMCDYVRHLYYKLKSGGVAYSSMSASSSHPPDHQLYNGIQFKVPAYLATFSIFISFISSTISILLALAIVPRQVTPWMGLLLTYVWVFSLFLLMFGGYLQLIYLWGTTAARTLSSHSEPLDYDSGKGHQRHVLCDSASLFYWLIMGLAAIIVPSLPYVFGITALFLRLGLMVAGGMVLVAVITYTSEHLALRSFLRGLEKRDMSRTPLGCLC